MLHMAKMFAGAWGELVRESATSISSADADKKAGRSAARSKPAQPICHTRPEYLQAMLAYGVAVQLHPDGIDKDVFKAHYVRGANNVKAEAARIGVSRVHYYRLLESFVLRVYQHATRISGRMQ